MTLCPLDVAYPHLLSCLDKKPEKDIQKSTHDVYYLPKMKKEEMSEPVKQPITIQQTNTSKPERIQFIKKFMTSSEHRISFFLELILFLIFLWLLLSVIHKFQILLRKPNTYRIY